MLWLILAVWLISGISSIVLGAVGADRSAKYDGASVIAGICTVAAVVVVVLT